MAKGQVKVRFIGSHRPKRRARPPCKRHQKNVSGRRGNKK